MILQAAGTTTKKEPPNTEEFDGCRDGSQPVRPRGRTGPRPAPAPQTVATTATPGAADIFGLLAAAVVPAILPMLQDMAAGGSRRRRASTSDTEGERAPKRRRSDGIPRPPLDASEAAAGMPSELGELDPCFAAFERAHGFTLEPFVINFARRSLTPDVIPLVPIKLLQDTTEYVVPVEILRELQPFCKFWVSKVRAMAETSSEGRVDTVPMSAGETSHKEGEKSNTEEDDDFVIVDAPGSA